jgi:lysophospholipase L1-like esterase
MTPPNGRTPERTRQSGEQRWGRHAAQAVALAILGVLSLLVALTLTHPVDVAVLGQDVQVGAVAPSTSLGWSGPGEADLFGEGAVPTVAQFDGPIRPRIVWRQFNRDAAASAFIQTSPEDGHRVITDATSAVGDALARGWIAYFGRLMVVAGLVGALGYLVVVALGTITRGSRAPVRPAPRRIWAVALSALVAMGVTGSAAALTVQSARAQLAGVSTLADLTGTAPLVAAPSAAGPPRTDVGLVVIGDSTAAGVGNTPIADPDDTDIACERSQDAYAAVLESATGLRVENLACASATISEGLLGPQPDRRPVVPAPQVGVLKSIASLRSVIVSIGANDIGWSDFLMYCYGLPRCDDEFSQRLIQNRLDTFRLQYAQLLQQLSDLPTRPAVLITGYYDPFGERFDCTALEDPSAPAVPPPGYGFAAGPEGDQDTTTMQKVEPLRSILAQLNSVLTEGADAFGFTSVTPSFDGHELCTAQPWVQGLTDPHPFHPNAAGELAIAAALLPDLVNLLPR